MVSHTSHTEEQKSDASLLIPIATTQESRLSRSGAPHKALVPLPSLTRLSWVACSFLVPEPPVPAAITTQSTPPPLKVGHRLFSRRRDAILKPRRPVDPHADGTGRNADAKPRVDHTREPLLAHPAVSDELQQNVVQGVVCPSVIGHGVEDQR